jgi:hypothetical protein
MLTRSHGRVFILATLCMICLIVIFRITHHHSHSVFGEQHTKIKHNIDNSLLGVRSSSPTITQT